MRALLLVAIVALGACGSRKPPPPRDAIASTAPVPVHDGSACGRACDRYRACLPDPVWGERERDGCLDDCRKNLDEVAARRYGDCLAALTCSAIHESMSMDMGPAGYCYSTSIGR